MPSIRLLRLSATLPTSLLATHVASQGFTDLRTDSVVVATLNASNPDNHSRVGYDSVAGTDKGT